MNQALLVKRTREKTIREVANLVKSSKGLKWEWYWDKIIALLPPRGRGWVVMRNDWNEWREFPPRKNWTEKHRKAWRLKNE